jgi:hypothetical protein
MSNQIINQAARTLDAVANDLHDIDLQLTDVPGADQIRADVRYMIAALDNLSAITAQLGANK